MTTELTKQSLLDALSLKQKYKNVFPFISQALRGNPLALKAIDSTLLHALVHHKSTPFSKLSALRLFKDMLLTGRMDIIDYLSEEIEGQVVAAAQYNAASNELEKGTKYFAEVDKYKEEDDLGRLSASYVLMALEIIALMAKWYPIDEDQDPSRFAEYYRQLSKVKFPTADAPRFFKKEDETKFKTNHLKWIHQIKLQQQASSQKQQQANSKKQLNNNKNQQNSGKKQQNSNKKEQNTNKKEQISIKKQQNITKKEQISIKKQQNSTKQLQEQSLKEIKKENLQLKSIMQSMKSKIHQLEDKLKAASLHTAQCQKQLNQKRKTQNNSSQQNRARYETEIKQKNLLLKQKQKIVESYERQVIEKDNIIESISKQLTILRQKCTALTTKLRQSEVNSLCPMVKAKSKERQQEEDEINSVGSHRQSHKQTPSLRQPKRQQIIRSFQPNTLPQKPTHPPDWSMSDFLAKRTIVEEVNVANIVTLSDAKRRLPLPRTEQSASKDSFKHTANQWRGVKKIESNHRSAINWHNRQ